MKPATKQQLSAYFSGLSKLGLDAKIKKYGAEGFREMMSKMAKKKRPRSNNLKP